MNVLDHSSESRWLDDVSIVTPTGHPETSLGSLATSAGDSRQPLWRFPFEELNRLAANRFLNGTANAADVVFDRARTNDDVGMFRHEHERPHVEFKFDAGCFNRIGQPTSCPLGSEKREPTVTGERQLVCVSRQIVVLSMPVRFAVRIDERLRRDVSVCNHFEKVRLWHRRLCHRHPRCRYRVLQMDFNRRIRREQESLCNLCCLLFKIVRWSCASFALLFFLAQTLEQLSRLLWREQAFDLFADGGADSLQIGSGGGHLLLLFVVEADGCHDGLL